jgi:hypothetical protein
VKLDEGKKLEFFEMLDRKGVYLDSNIIGLCALTSYYYDNKSGNIEYIQEQKLSGLL